MHSCNAIQVGCLQGGCRRVDRAKETGEDGQQLMWQQHRATMGGTAEWAAGKGEPS